MDVKKFIWERYDPCNCGFIRVKTMIQDIILAIVGFIATIIWLYGIIIFCRMILNPSLLVSGITFMIVISTVLFTVVFTVVSLAWLGFEANEGNIKPWNKIMDYKLFER